MKKFYYKEISVKPFSINFSGVEKIIKLSPTEIAVMKPLMVNGQLAYPVLSLDNCPEGLENIFVDIANIIWGGMTITWKGLTTVATGLWSSATWVVNKVIVPVSTTVYGWGKTGVEAIGKFIYNPETKKWVWQRIPVIKDLLTTDNIKWGLGLLTASTLVPDAGVDTPSGEPVSPTGKPPIILDDGTFLYDLPEGSITEKQWLLLPLDQQKLYKRAIMSDGRIYYVPITVKTEDKTSGDNLLTYLLIGGGVVLLLI
jgi:hypothetical protein